MNRNYRFLYPSIQKTAAAVLTPEAEQAAMQPPAPAQGGAPMDPSMMGSAPGGAPMDPAAMGGAPAAATGPNGGQIPPEILQDQQFIQFLAQAMGIQLDQASGTFIGPDGQPIPAEMIVQAYQEFQTQMQQGGMVGAPMDPSMAGGAPMDPAAMGGAPADPAMQSAQPMDPAMMGATPAGAPVDPGSTGGAPADPMMAGAADPAAAGMDPATSAGNAEAGAPDASMDMINEISSAVMSGVEAVLQDLVAGQEKKISAILDKVDMLKEEIASLRDTTDKRKQADEDAEKQLRDEISADLNPVIKQATAVPVPKPISMSTTPKTTTRNLFSIISGVKA